MKIRLNGQEAEIPDGTDLLGLLALQGLPSELVAVELNEAMVPRAKREGQALKEGDVVEILKMIAGGASPRPSGTPLLKEREHMGSIHAR